MGDALEMNLEGIVFGAAEVLVYINTLLPSGLLGDRWSLVLSLFMLAVIVFRTIYSIRLFLRLARVFGMSRWWLIGWLLIRSLPLLILRPDLQMTLLDSTDANLFGSDSLSAGLFADKKKMYF